MREQLMAFAKEKRIRDCGLLALLNVFFASNYLLSPSNLMLGFMYRQDAYWYMVIVNHLQKLLTEGFVPLGVTWLKYAYCGIPEVVHVDPMYSIYLVFSTTTGDLVLSWKLTTFLFYVMSSIAMYYLTYVLTSDRIASLVSSTAYTFSQILVFEVFLGHLSMVVGFALIPLITATYVKAVRNASRLATILSALLLSWLLIVRPDFAYFTITFLILLFLYFALIIRAGMKSILYSGVLFIIAFLFAYPLLEPRYLSPFRSLTQHVGRYNYAFYSPKPYHLFIPYMKSLGVYLGITVLLFSAIGFAVALKRVFSLRSHSSEKDKFASFLLTGALIYIIIGVGAATPIYGWLYRHAPFFSTFNVPTRWLVLAQLCLAIIAGIGASSMIRSSLKRSSYRLILTLVVIAIVFFDLSTYVAPSIYEQQGWRSLTNYDFDSALFLFPQASYAPESNTVYDYICQDRSSSFRVLSAPIVYSRSYYQYVQYLKDTNVTFAYDYVQFRLRSEFQTEVYNGFRYGNFTDSIGEQMALLGVKYVVYNFYWGEWENLVMKMNRTDDLKFLLQDKGYVLYRNKRFGDVSNSYSLIEDGGFEEGDEFWIPQNMSEGLSEIDHTVSRSGISSMKLSSTGDDALAERTQIIDLTNELEAVEFTISGWARAENIYGENPLVAIQATIAYTDGSHSESAWAQFSAGTHDWEYSSVDFQADSTKTVNSIRVSVFLNATGKAWFDDVYLTERRPTHDWSGGYIVKKLYTDIGALLSEQNRANATMTLHRENAMTLRLQIVANEPAYLILSESHDDGWRIYPKSMRETLGIEEHNSLITLFVAQPGEHTFTLKFDSHSESLSRILLHYTIAAVVIALFMIPLDLYDKIAQSIKNFIRNVRIRLLYS